MENEKIYFTPGDTVRCKQLPDAPLMYVLRKKELTFKDAENMKWSDEEQEHVAPIVETTITKCRNYIANSYDTFLRISSISPPSSTGASATPPVEEDRSNDLSNLQTE